MELIELQQGTPAWIAHRRKHYNASEAAAMLGLDPKLSRQELVRMYAIGNEKEFSQFVLDRVIEPGHAMEDAARPLVEAEIGEDLFPCTARLEVGGVPLSASFDGITMAEDVIWEHKRRNAELVAAVKAGKLPDDKWPQVQQGMLISGATRALFTVSDGTAESAVHLWVQADAHQQARIVAGWVQFREDVAAYEHVEVLPAEKAAPPKELPELVVALVGEVRSSNLTTWAQAMNERIRGISTDLQTDNDFAVAEVTVKFLGDGEDKLEFVKKQALAQTAGIDELFKTIDALRAEMRTKRLNLEKLVEARKTTIRASIVQRGKDAMAAHLASLVERIGKPYLPAVAADFPGAIKGKRSIQAMQDAVATELARAKIEANAIADRIDVNLRALRELAAGQGRQFPDTAQIVLKDPADLVNLVKARLAENAAEAARKEAETRARIEAETRAKVEAEAAEAVRAASQAAARAADAAVAKAQESAQTIQAGTGIVDVRLDSATVFNAVAAPLQAAAPASQGAGQGVREILTAEIVRVCGNLTIVSLRGVLQFAKNMPVQLTEGNQ